MIDEVVGFLILIFFLTLAYSLLWYAYTYSLALPKDVGEIAEKCLDAYYNNSSVEGFTCEVYGRRIG